MKKISLRNFARHLVEKVIPQNPEGFTCCFQTGEQPLFGKDEYIVSIFGHECRMRRPVCFGYVHRWLRRNACAFEDSSHLVGGWLDHQSGMFVLDVSTVVRGLDEALNMASMNRQQAIYCPAEDTTIYLEEQERRTA